MSRYYYPANHRSHYLEPQLSAVSLQDLTPDLFESTRTMILQLAEREISGVADIMRRIDALESYVVQQRAFEAARRDFRQRHSERALAALRRAAPVPSANRSEEENRGAVRLDDTFAHAPAAAKAKAAKPAKAPPAKASRAR